MIDQFIRRARLSRGLSQQTVAEVAGVTQPNLSAYERGRRVPTADTLNRILAACGYELAAVAGTQVIACPLPAGPWYPGFDPPAVAGDPADEEPLVTTATPMTTRVRVLLDAIALAEAAG